jgi:hypothetical protein
VSAESTSSTSSAELVAGFLSVISMVASLLAIFYDPLRVIPFAVLIALVAVGMSPRGARLPLLAVGVSAVCFIVGMTVAVTTNNPIY